MTSNVNNQGIAHLGQGNKAGGLPICKARRGHISVAREQFNNWRQCKRCAKILAKWEAKETKGKGE